ncbi:MAG: hypothetical protein WAW39_03705 [Prosthecobacter sp.]|uniref:hypothetical protein n=1 Tax=Prosthecobacter sp. TaxID=1965333 RepID=UPI003BAF3180
MTLRPTSGHGWLCASTLLGTVAVLACGPFFPENALDQPRGILRPPLFHFQSEMKQTALPPDVRVMNPPGTPAFTLDLEMEELKQIMAGQPMDEAWFGSYRELRRAMLHDGDRSEHSMRPKDDMARPPWSKVKQDLAKIIAPLPEDMRLYLQGAAARLDAKDLTVDDPFKTAREFWLQLLALPAEKRANRSTWAAWMLFRTTPHDEQGRWLAETRRLARAGFKDCLHLGIEAAYILGRQGSDYAEASEVKAAEWKRAAMLRAPLGLSHAEDRLRHDRRLLVDWSEDFAREVLAAPFLRRVQMLQLIESMESLGGWSTGQPQKPLIDDNLQQWLASFEKAGVTDQQEAVLLAWITYNAARFDEARRWLALAPAEDVNALALRGKLAALRGNRQEAQKALTRMATKLPTPEPAARRSWEREQQNEWYPLSSANYAAVRTHKLLADCGVAQVARNDFAGALQTFLRTDYWSDAAYIAERLLSVEELLALSHRGKIKPLKKMSVPDAEPRTGPLSIGFLETKYGGWMEPDGMDRFTYLVARRLAREGLIKEACKLLPADLERALLRFDAERRRSKDARLTAAERGRALWTAAQIERRLGMELFGYEDAPDFTLCGGLFHLDSFHERRKSPLWRSRWEDAPQTPEEALKFTPMLPATADELWSLRHYSPPFEQRFHYRYVAADLAWRAARLMPDDQEETALVLATAGNWLKNRDNKSADRFYKALVNRNPSVPMAQEADQKRWLPEMDWRFDLTLE